MKKDFFNLKPNVQKNFDGSVIDELPLEFFADFFTAFYSDKNLDSLTVEKGADAREVLVSTPSDPNLAMIFSNFECKTTDKQDKFASMQYLDAVIGYLNDHQNNSRQISSDITINGNRVLNYKLQKRDINLPKYVAAVVDKYREEIKNLKKEINDLRNNTPDTSKFTVNYHISLVFLDEKIKAYKARISKYNKILSSLPATYGE